MTTTIPTPPPPTGHGYISDKDRYLARLKRIEDRPVASTAWWVTLAAWWSRPSCCRSRTCPGNSWFG